MHIQFPVQFREGLRSCSRYQFPGHDHLQAPLGRKIRGNPRNFQQRGSVLPGSVANPPEPFRRLRPVQKRQQIPPDRSGHFPVFHLPCRPGLHLGGIDRAAKLPSLQQSSGTLRAFFLRKEEKQSVPGGHPGQLPAVQHFRRLQPDLRFSHAGLQMHAPVLSLSFIKEASCFRIKAEFRSGGQPQRRSAQILDSRFDLLPPGGIQRPFISRHPVRNQRRPVRPAPHLYASVLPPEPGHLPQGFRRGRAVFQTVSDPPVSRQVEQRPVMSGHGYPGFLAGAAPVAHVMP